MKKAIFLALLLVGLSLSQIRLKVTKPALIRDLMEGSIETKVIMWGKHDTMNDLVSPSKIAEPKNGCLKYTNVDPKDKKRYVYFI